jgi:hypothetical protein
MLRPRLRLVAGLTLLALAVLTLGRGSIAMLAPREPEDWAAFGGFVVVLVLGVPTLLAAIAVLRGGTKGGAFGGVVSLLLGGAVAWMLSQEISVLNGVGGTSLDYGQLLVEGAMVVAYAFAGIASFQTMHARDKPPVSDAP